MEGKNTPISGRGYSELKMDEDECGYQVGMKIGLGSGLMGLGVLTGAMPGR